MTYRSNNIFVANCINTVLIPSMEKDMIALGWVKVTSQNITPNGANVAQTVVWDILKSPGNKNSMGNDWYIALGTDQQTNCNLWVTMFAGWNTTTNLASQYCPAPPAYTVATTANVQANGFANGVSNTLNVSLVCALSISNVAPNVANGPGAFQGMHYWYSVTIDRVICAIANTYSYHTTSTTASNSFYCGMYDSFQPLSVDPYPLICSYMANFQPNPGFTVGSIGFCINEYPASFQGSVAGAFNGVPTGAYSFAGVTSDNYIRGGASRIMILGHYNGTVNQSGMRGLYKDVYAVGINPLMVPGHMAYLVTPNNTPMNLVSIGYTAPASQGAYTTGPVGPWMLTI